MNAPVVIRPDGTDSLTMSARSALAPGWILDVVAVCGLLAPGVLAFGPVFGGTRGYVAAAAGAGIGLALGFLAHRLRWGALTLTAVLLLAYLLGGGAITLRDTTIGGFIPSVTTLSRLAQLIVHSWRDLLTSGIPADGFTGPAVVPFASGLAAGAISMRLALARRVRLWAVAPAVVFLLVGILWGIKIAPYAVWQGGAFATVALAWMTVRHEGAVQQAGDRPSRDPRRAALAVAMIVTSVLAGVLAAPALAAHTNRHVLRDDVTPPLDAHDLASPLVQFHHLATDLEHKTLLTVTGLPAGQRLRMAVLDAYDGHVYTVSGASAEFIKVGERVELAPPTGTPTRLHVVTGDLHGPWVPGGGDVRQVTFSGPQARDLARSLYVNPATGSVLTTVGLGGGTAYDIDVVLPEQPSPDVLRTSSARAIPLPDNTNVPDVVGKMAVEFAKGMAGAFDQAHALATKLALGAYANGTARAGHSAERIASFLKASERAQLTGDDEQYAVAMALMARHLGLPARVVMGFYPPAGTTADPVILTGRDAHVWVEVAFTPNSWASFDPTPDRDRKPRQRSVQEKEQSSPQVLPPPAPPVSDVQRPNDLDTTRRPPQTSPTPPAWHHVLAIGLYAAGGLAAASSPFVLVVAAKRRRRERRRRATRTADRVSGGWSEILDRATDLGSPVPTRMTHREGAGYLGEAFVPVSAAAVAERIESRLFAPDEPSEADAALMWHEIDGLLAAMSRAAGRRRALRARFSLRSFRRHTNVDGSAGRGPSASSTLPSVAASLATQPPSVSGRFAAGLRRPLRRRPPGRGHRPREAADIPDRPLRPPKDSR